MAKHSKDYDILYAAYKGTFFDYEDALFITEGAKSIDSWELTRGMPTEYPLAQVLHAVYRAEGFEDWQKFRVSLKGCSTALKLARLEYRWNYFQKQATKELWQVEQLRITNYIGALRRGGFLDARYNIIKG